MKNTLIFIFALALLAGIVAGCSYVQENESASGVKQASVIVSTDSNGNSIEQMNIKERLTRDNKPGSIKFLYLVSPFTGDIILQSTVRGKVTSSGKRLTPTDVIDFNPSIHSSKRIEINGRTFWTSQTPGDDGTYGDSMPYLYWFDQNNVYHQTYVGSAIIHITDQPITFYKSTQRIEKR